MEYWSVVEFEICPLVLLDLSILLLLVLTQNVANAKYGLRQSWKNKKNYCFAKYESPE